MDHYDIAIDYAEMPSAAECHEDDCYFTLSRGHAIDVARVIGGIEDLGELAERIAEVIRAYRGTRSEITSAAHLAARELHEYLAREMARQV